MDSLENRQKKDFVTATIHRMTRRDVPTNPICANESIIVLCADSKFVFNSPILDYLIVSDLLIGYGGTIETS